MKTIEVTPNEDELNAVLDCAREEDVLVRAADGTQFMVTVIDEFDEEIIRTRRNEKLMAFLEKRAQPTARISSEEVKRSLGL